ncbi:MAG: hypothetical protein WCI77_06945 [Candidatus Omnitrophota bacterium]
MPVLHKYSERLGYYVLANIKGNIVTFQTTEAGVSRLKEAGYKSEQKFPLQILVDLVRSGDVFTYGSGAVKVSDPKQLKFEDLAPAPEVEKLFPQCDKCGSFDDLRLIVVGPSKEKESKMLCEVCALKLDLKVQANIPVSILTHTSLNLLIEQQSLNIEDKSIKALKDWFAAEMSKFWKEHSKKRKSQQTSFDFKV